MTGITAILDEYQQFDIDRERALLGELAGIDGFSRLVPEDSPRYFDQLLDKVVIHRSRLDS
ncbi:hypothetical protein KY363_05470, partial [Candidatus Woesearchaeota archaeon]|nr:hypothetical protein [Candidatus Woesearchaeota archaeon]